MDEKLSELLAADGVQLTNVQLNKKTNTLQVEIQAARLLEKRRMDRLESALKEMLPECAVSVRFTFPRAAAELEDNFAGTAALLSQSWAALAPTLRPVLRCARWAREAEPKGSAQRAQVAAILQRFIEEANF